MEMQGKSFQVQSTVCGNSTSNFYVFIICDQQTVNLLEK